MFFSRYAMHFNLIATHPPLQILFIYFIVKSKDTFVYKSRACIFFLKVIHHKNILTHKIKDSLYPTVEQQCPG